MYGDSSPVLEKNFFATQVFIHMLAGTKGKEDCREEIYQKGGIKCYQKPFFHR